MENLKEIFEINGNKEINSLNNCHVSEKVENLKVHCGASDSYFEDM